MKSLYFFKSLRLEKIFLNKLCDLVHLPINSTGSCYYNQDFWISLTFSFNIKMSPPTRESYFATGSSDSDRNKISTHNSYNRQHYPGNTNSNCHQNSNRQHGNRHNNSNSNRNRTPQYNVNMYLQRRDYYHPIYNQYRAALLLKSPLYLTCNMA